MCSTICHPHQQQPVQSRINDSMTVSEVVGGIVKVYDVEKDPEKCANFSYNNSFCSMKNK